MIDNFWAVVPAGGAGTRLWPVSRATAPKFLRDLRGSGRTLIQETHDRLGPLAPGRVLVVTGAAHRDAVAGQLDTLAPEAILAEPSARDSMAAIGLAAALIERARPRMLVAVHSFTPSLATSDEERPWEVALLYNQDERAAQHAIRLFREQGLTVGDNQPYSGKQLNATMDRHAEANGIPYCTVEIRQDQIDTAAGQARWAVMLADIMGRVALEV